MKNTKEFNVLICGSEKFDDRSFVFGMLDAFYANSPIKITNFVVGNFAGASAYTREWVDNHNESVLSENPKAKEGLVGIRDFGYDMFLGRKNIEMYQTLDIPDVIVQNDEFFQEGKNKLMENNIQLILAFPNNEKILGVSTSHIVRFAKLAKIVVMDCTTVFQKILDHRQSIIDQAETMDTSPTVEKPNRLSSRPNRRM